MENGADLSVCVLGRTPRVVLQATLRIFGRPLAGPPAVADTFSEFVLVHSPLGDGFRLIVCFAVTVASVSSRVAIILMWPSPKLCQTTQPRPSRPAPTRGACGKSIATPPTFDSGLISARI